MSTYFPNWEQNGMTIIVKDEENNEFSIYSAFYFANG